MTTIVVSVLAGIWTTGLVILAISARRAPLGVEDEEGFRALPEDRQDELVYGAETQAH